VPNHSTHDACASHQPAGQQSGSGAKSERKQVWMLLVGKDASADGGLCSV